MSIKREFSFLFSIFIKKVKDHTAAAECFLTLPTPDLKVCELW